MRPEDREQWFWQLTAEADPLAEEEAPTQDGASVETLLQAYRRGELTPAEQSQVERLLVREPERLARLEALSEVEDPIPPRDVRQDLLDRFGAPAGAKKWVAKKKVTKEKVAEDSRKRLWWGAGLAASFAVVVVAGFLSMSWFSGPDMPPPSYDVTFTALGDQRGESAESPQGIPVAIALPETLVTITATVRGRAEEGIDMALYRSTAGGLERVSGIVDQHRQDRPGAVRFRIPAWVLVGSKPGSELDSEASTYRLFLAVSKGKELPLLLPLPNASELDEPEILGGFYRLYSLILQLKPSTSPAAD